MILVKLFSIIKNNLMILILNLIIVIKIILIWIRKSKTRETIASVILMLLFAISIDYIYDYISEPHPLEKAIKHYENGEYKIADKLLDYATSQDPCSEKAWFYKGVVLFKLKKINESIEASEIALEINPNYINALFNKGICYESLADGNNNVENYEKALKCFHEVNIKSQSFGSAWIEIYRINLKLNRTNDAEEALNRAREMGYGYSKI